MISADAFVASKSFQLFQTSFAGSFSPSIWQARVGLTISKRTPLFPCIKCENTGKNDGSFEHVSDERPAYHSYWDPSSGQLEPASGECASFPGKEYWPEGTAGRVRAANAPEPTGVSTGTPSYGKSPGSRRKKYKASVSASESSGMSTIVEDTAEAESINDGSEEHKDLFSDFVVYQTEPEKELTEYELDKEHGSPHPFIDPQAKETEEILPSEELWWNWRKPDKDRWTRWQKPRPDTETVFLKAMAETGQIKLHGEHPTETEKALYRARRHLYKEERLQAEQERLERVGPLAYYSEWVKDWKKDTSREAVQKHFEETGEDENTQLMEMFTHQTFREYRIMMGTDLRIRRDPLAIRMSEEKIKQVWGGDPVYPTVNYIQDPDEVTDYRGPDFHEPTPDMVDYLKEHGHITPKKKVEKILAQEKTEEFEISDIDKAMAQAVDIGVKDEGEDSETESAGEEEKLSRNWSVMKSTPELLKSKGTPKKDYRPLKEAIDDSENLTDYMLDFDEEE